MEGSNLELHISLPPPKWSTTSTHTVVSEQSLTGKLSGSWLLGCIQEVGGKDGGEGGALLSEFSHSTVLVDKSSHV